MSLLTGINPRCSTRSTPSSRPREPQLGQVDPHAERPERLLVTFGSWLRNDVVPRPPGHRRAGGHGGPSPRRCPPSAVPRSINQGGKSWPAVITLKLNPAEFKLVQSALLSRRRSARSRSRTSRISAKQRQGEAVLFGALLEKLS
jgi:hypothetical protein